MLAIKLRPVGKKKQISYRVVVSEKKSKLKGKFIDDLGFYNPHSKMSELKEDKIKYWLSQGVKPTDTVYNLLVSKGIIEGEKKKINLTPSKKEKPAKEEAKEEVTDEKKEETKGPAKEEPAEEKKEEEEIAKEEGVEKAEEEGEKKEEV